MAPPCGFPPKPAPPGAANRWLAVAPKRAKTQIILYLPDENWQHYRQVVGKSQAITLNVTNMQQLYTKLLRKGVKYIQAPDVQPDGRADMCDSCPDITIYDGKFINSCRMDEYRLFGGFVSLQEKKDEPEKEKAAH